MHAEVISRIREVCEETRRVCAILLDTKGPEIRTCMLEGGKEVRLHKDQEFVLSTDEKMMGTTKCVGVTYKNLPKIVKPGCHVLVDDGIIDLLVKSVTDTTVTCVVQNAASLGQQKGVNLPGLVIDLPAITDKDKLDIKFGVEQKVDFIAASFIRTADNIREIKSLISGSNTKLSPRSRARRAWITSTIF